MSALNNLFTESKIIVCVGSGGVGKTTLAASLGLQGALKGKKVLLLTVDPSKRLAQTLGISLSEHLLQKVEISHELERSLVSSTDKTLDSIGSSAAVPMPDGELWAILLNSKFIFDDFVTRYSARPELAEKLMGNKLYQQLSTTLSGSQEFTSLELLLQQSQVGQFDLIILDTPPTQHALDFLRAPQTIRQLFQEGVTKWFLNPDVFDESRWWGKVFSFGTKKVFQSLELLTGKEFIVNLQDFFVHIRSLQGQLRDRSEAAEKLLRDSKTSFLLVTGFDEAKFKETLFLNEMLEKEGLTLKLVVVNRALPRFQIDRNIAEVEGITSTKKAITGVNTLTTSPLRVTEINKFIEDLSLYYAKRQEVFERLKLQLFHVPVVKVPDYDEDLHTLKDLHKILEDIQ